MRIIEAYAAENAEFMRLVTITAELDSRESRAVVEREGMLHLDPTVLSEDATVMVVRFRVKAPDVAQAVEYVLSRVSTFAA
jgi:hypothetical protein